jgi:flagellar biosynthesis protein FlhA
MPDIEFLLPLSGLLTIPVEDLLTGGYTNKNAEHANETPPAENPMQPAINALQTDEILIKFGYSVIPVIESEPTAEGSFFNKIHQLRRSIVQSHGILIPLMRFMDNINMDVNDYTIDIMNKTVAKGTVYPGMSVTLLDKEGTKFTDPVTGKNAVWVPDSEINPEEADQYISCSDFLLGHIRFYLEQNLPVLVTREMVKLLVDAASVKFPITAEEAVPNRMPYGKFAELIAALLQKGKSVRNMYAVLNYICNAPSVEDIPALAEGVAELL